MLRTIFSMRTGFSINADPAHLWEHHPCLSLKGSDALTVSMVFKRSCTA